MKNFSFMKRLEMERGETLLLTRSELTRRDLTFFCLVS
jgi:hypothetical protein